MRKLLLLALMAAPAVVSAQSTRWVGSPWPDTARMTPAMKAMVIKANDNPHGIAVGREGKVWIQPYYPRSGDSVAVPNVSTARRQMAGAVYVFKADGTPASFSPILFLDYPGGARDTVGGATLTTVNSTGQTVKTWAQIGGRGLATDQNGDIIATFSAATSTNNTVASNTLRIVRINHQTGAGMARANLMAYGVDYRGSGAPDVDRNGRVYVTGIFAGDVMASLNPDLSFLGNVKTNDVGFTRASGVSTTGDSVYHLAYDLGFVLRYSRKDEFSDYSTVDTLLRGIAAESFARHPVMRNQVWFGSGSKTNVPDSTKGYWRNKWYAFNEADLSLPVPPKRDSIVWNRPLDAKGRPATDGRPRGMGFSPDGNTAYVIQFSNVGEPFGIQRFVKMPVAVDGYGRWVPDDILLTVGPNPTQGALHVRYRGLANTPVRIELFDGLGRRVATLVDGLQPDGEQRTSFDTSGLAAGTYYVRFTGGDATVSRPVSVLR